MTSDERIAWLRDRVAMLKALLDDPQPGLHTWVEAYGKLMTELTDFWRKDFHKKIQSSIGEAVRPDIDCWAHRG